MSFLLTLSLFSGIFITVNQWTTHQRKNAVEIYQRYQAIQIAENQKQRQFLGLSCETSVIQNHIQFSIQCQGERVSISYPSGKIQF